MGVDRAPFSLYIHIPYCISKCPYCDFNSHVVPEIPEHEYTHTLLQELDWYERKNDWGARRIQTVFFGGGTPSTFSARSIGRILDRTFCLFPMDSQCEITLEANPGTVDRENFRGYRLAGVNRISLGVQSFQPRLLQFLGRVHSANEAKQALETVREAGFANFNLDLIYANPGQTIGELEDDIDTAVSFDSPHISAYNLTIEEGTPFHHEYRAGRLRLLDENEEIAMAELIRSKLAAAGFHRYEISNYARPGFESRHNVNYWRSGDYLGIGAGAHSYKTESGNGIYGHRWWNEKSPARYMSKVKEFGNAVSDREDTDLHKAAGEFMFSGLRLTDGISLTEFTTRFRKDVLELYPEISRWVSDGLMEKNADRLRLTTRGLLLANAIFVNFV